MNQMLREAFAAMFRRLWQIWSDAALKREVEDRNYAGREIENCEPMFTSAFGTPSAKLQPFTVYKLWLRHVRQLASNKLGGRLI